MFAKERQDKIYHLLQQNGAVTTLDLVNTFQVSIETIRRDLLYMEQNKLLRRVHGGAVTAGEMLPFHNLDLRNEEHPDEKLELSEIAMQFVKEGDIIGVDAGSTAISFAQTLKTHFSRLTIITHSIDVFHILHRHADFTVLLCGGHFMQDENAFYGELALDFIGKLHMQKSFLFPSGISLKFGLCDYQQELAQMQKKMLECSDSIYILADSSKFEKTALLKVDDMKPEYTYITDSGLSEDLQKIYLENQLHVVTAP